MEAQQQEQQEQMQQQQSQHELVKLRAIESKVQQVQDKLTTRMPHQRSQLIARVCGSIWLNRVRLSAALAKSTSNQGQQDALTQYEQIAKKMRMELGVFDYQVKEQGELLTRYLCELDNILSFGNVEVKDARKALVVYIQRLLTTADAFRAKSARLKAFGEELLSTLPKPVIEEIVSESEGAASSTHDAADGVDVEQTASPRVSEVADVEMKPLFAEEDDEEEEDDAVEDEENGDEDMGEGAQNDEEAESQAQNQDMKTQSSPSMNQHIAHQQHQRQRQPASTINIRSLPLWRPYYQLQRRRDGLYLIANLRDIDPQNLRVQWNEYTGVLRVSGHKLPTQKDIMVSRFSGVPTFGRFEIAERLPANTFNMDHATQTLNEDGTLEIHMPYYLVQHPRFFSQRSLFESPRCMVW